LAAFPVSQRTRQGRGKIARKLALPGGLGWTLLCILCLNPSFATADPDYGDFVLYGFDPVLRSTADPRLLGVERLVARQRLLRQGIDPVRTADSPSLASTMRQEFDDKVQVDLRRLVTVSEANGFAGLWTAFQYPEFFFLFQASETLPGGFVYYPPRPVTADEVDIFVDDLPAAQARLFAVDRRLARAALLDVRGKAGGGGASDGVNLTIPIKLPRTLEKIIGRGEKTNIRITGREHISISGESTVSNKFTPTERVQKQSLFPTLDMEQQLQINLAGTIGEKIHVEVDHNSQVIGPEATKIRLRYEGTEDEIIKTIETGDVGLTLPGTQLLGYSSNKSGLFGIKVTGQVGRADFTVVASKQKAESAAKSFNSRGGEVSDHIVEASQYLNNRFFRLDLPLRPGNIPPGAFGYPDSVADAPGRTYGAEFIDPSSVQVFLNVSGQVAQPGDVDYVAAYIDTTGRWPASLLTDTAPFTEGVLWRPVDFELLLDQNNRLIALDLQREYYDGDELAVVYDVVGDLTNPQGTLLYSVGDKPDRPPSVDVTGDGEKDYRMKLLKGQNREPTTFQYVLRNIYALGGSPIDFDSFDLRIEFKDQSQDHPEQDESGLPWIQIFGLDRRSPQDPNDDPSKWHPDGIVDKNDTFLFDLQNGLLKFPLDFPQPFNAAQEDYEALADTSAFVWSASKLQPNRIPEIYDPTTIPSNYLQYSKFRIVASHASAASTFNLGASNIEEGSEAVVLDGQTLQKGRDYDIDYQFGEITLKGDAAGRLGADSQISVNYQFAPFFGGGKSSLLGINTGYDLGKGSRLSTTWLYESNQIAGHKAKLGEEPSRTLVGNLNIQHTFKPYFLTHVANFLSRHDSEKESTLQFNGEMAVSIPNPNTRGKVYLEDFEGIDASDMLTMSRLSWNYPSPPAHGDAPAYNQATGDNRKFYAANRVPVVRWYLPQDRVLRRYLNPELREQERQETQQALNVYLRAGDDAAAWQPYHWGGIMRGVSRVGIDLSKAQFLEFWINDFRLEGDRRGTIHLDFGFLSEDFFWPKNGESGIDTLSYQLEDSKPRDGIFVNQEEDTGLDGFFGGGDTYSADSGTGNNPFPQINGTEYNNREDSEDLDGDSVFDLKNGYFTLSVDLADSALVDVLRDYNGPDVDELRAEKITWRKYRLRLGDLLRIEPPGGTRADISVVTHVRVWYEDAAPGAPNQVKMQLADIKFLGSRWEREGIRKRLSEEILETAERRGAEFFIGEKNNKENPDYQTPLPPHEENRIPEKESSLEVNFQNLQHDQVIRVSKLVSPRGDDYTQYRTLTWWMFSPSHELADLDLFFRVGADTTNFYEVQYRFAESPFKKDGWKQVRVDLAELSNTKNDPPDTTTGWIESRVTDPENGEVYRVRVVGRPDLRRVKQYYFGVINDPEHGAPDGIDGYVYLNDILLEGVKREMGLAERVALRLNMADVVKVDFDWSKRDADFHGLNASTGQGSTDEDWSLTTSFRVDDFVPLLGFQLPVNLSRRQTVNRPKYITNSDIELIDPDEQNRQSTIDERESFSVRLNHSPSRAAIPRYIIDPWAFSLSGSRSSRKSPLDRNHRSNLQGSLTYNLRIPGTYTFGRYPLLKYVPVLKGTSFLPSKFTMSGNFNGSEQTSEAVNLDGTITPRPDQITRRGSISGSTEYAPLPIVALSFNARSSRDLLREQKLWGLNIGTENEFSQDFRANFTLPKSTMIPAHWLFYPLRTGIKAANEISPNATFNGSYSQSSDPSIRQPGDPPGVRGISNGGDWEFRARLPIDKFFKHYFPEKAGPSGEQRQQIIDRERRLEQRARRRGEPRAPESQPAAGQEEVPEDQGDQELEQPEEEIEDQQPSPADTDAAAEEVLTPEERRRREEEELLEAARHREEQELEELQARQRREQEEQPDRVPPGGEGQVEGAAAQTEAQPDQQEAAWDVAADEKVGTKFKFPNPLSPVLDIMRNISPVQMSLTQRRSSRYTRYAGTTEFLYRVGLLTEQDVDPSLYASREFQDRDVMTLSTNMKVTRQLGLDVKFNKSTSSRDAAGLVTKSYQQDWPDLNVSLAGMEKWSIFGGGGENEGWFRAANVNCSFKQTRTVSGYTSTYFNPQTTTNISPRWNVTFRNGMSASMNVTLSNGRNLSNGSVTETNRQSVQLQLRHSFRAERLLSKLNLYKPGSSPTVNMDVDISYSRNTNQRTRPGAEFSDAPTGTTRLSFNPRFSYQINRNLSGALRLIYSRDKTLESDLVRQSFGLGLEATFVF
jgi:hypothetical protein